MSDLSEHLRLVLSDRYRIERPLGRGGMATVLLAEDLKHHRRVAIKVLDPDVAIVIGPERFQHEIETVARLTHPHVLALHDSGAADGLLYYVMPFVEGGSLRDRLKREKQLPLDDALKIAREVADALSYAHSSGVVHRDVKPENILLEQGHAVVADFGIARAIAAVEPEKLTATGIVLGTPPYMSPEQAAGSREIDGRSDLYSLGCVLYEMLAGQPPFTGPTAESFVYQHLNVSPRPVTELRPAVPAGVAAALQRALAKMPADRFNPVALFGEALGSTTLTPPPSHAIARPQSRRPWLAVVAVLLATVVVVAAVAVWQRWGPFERWSGRAESTTSARREWIFLADFDGPPEDPSLARTAREIVRAGLDQSMVVAVLPWDQIQIALEQAGQPDTSHLTPQLSRELAYRIKVRVMLEGEIQKLGGVFSATLRAVDVEENRTILVVSDGADSEDALIPMLGRMAQRVRESLGERPEVLQTTRPDDYPTATPSFRAYRRMSESLRLFYLGDNAGALSLVREAVATDPNCGGAWALLGLVHRNMGRPDSAIAAFEEALRHPETYTPAYRQVIEGRLAWLRGDLRGAVGVFERVTRLYPGSREAEFALNHLAILHFAEGRIIEALAAESLGVEGRMVSNMARFNLAQDLMILGRLSEARLHVSDLQGGPRSYCELRLALAQHNWARADSLSLAYEADPRINARILARAAITRGDVAAVRGEVDVALAHMRRAVELEHARGRPSIALRGGRSAAMLAVAAGRPVPPPEPWIAGNTTTSAIITRAYMAAAAGDTSSARRLLSELRALQTTRLGAHGATPEFIEACISARAGRWEEVIQLIEKPAREGADRGNTDFDRLGIAPERWLVAKAFQQLGRPDSAAAFYLRVLAPDTPTRCLDSFARQRLVVLLADMGRIAEAEQHLAVLERDFTNPDADLVHLLDDARAAVRRARGV